jgi:hypothetical protein
MIVRDQGPLDGCADQPIEPDDRVEGEQPLDDTCPQPGGDASAVAFEAELVLQRPDDRLDALPQPVRELAGFLLVLAGRADEGRLQLAGGEELLGLLAGQALVGDDGGAGRGLAPERLPGLFPLAAQFRVQRRSPPVGCPARAGRIGVRRVSRSAITIGLQKSGRV